MIAMQTKCGDYVKQMLPLRSTYQIPEPGSIALRTEKVHVTGYRVRGSYMEVKYQVFFPVTPKMLEQGKTNRMANTFSSSNSTQPLGPLKLLQPEASEEKRKRFKHEQHLLLLKWHVKYKCKAYENHHDDVSNVCMILYVVHVL